MVERILFVTESLDSGRSRDTYVRMPVPAGINLLWYFTSSFLSCRADTCVMSDKSINGTPLPRNFNVDWPINIVRPSLPVFHHVSYPEKWFLVKIDQSLIEFDSVETVIYLIANTLRGYIYSTSYWYRYPQDEEINGTILRFYTFPSPPTTLDFRGPLRADSKLSWFPAIQPIKGERKLQNFSGRANSFEARDFTLSQVRYRHYSKRSNRFGCSTSRYPLLDYSRHMMKQFGGEKSRLLKLGPIVGAPPRDSSHARPAERTQPLASAVPEPLSSREGDIHMTAEAWRSLVKVEQTHRIFFTAGADEETDGTGDLDADDRLSEIEGVKMPTKFWRHKPTGRVGLDRFRKAVDFVLIAKQLFTRGVRPNLTAEESILFFMDIPSAGGIELPKLPTSSQLTSSTLQTTPYKALKEQTTVSAVKSVLETLPAHRTEEQITATIQVLQGFSKFIGYPQHVQKGICQHGWYASFDPHRILCRQDQDAEIYYFILSGLAISRSLDQRDASQDNRRRQRAQFLRKGDVIGEKEILQNCCRESTVITKETVEVLGLDKQDFLDIFRSVMMQGESTVNFLKDMDVFSDFPTDLLHAHQYACSLHSFRRGAVIVHNSNESEWVYIIKEGSCQVYKAIKSRSTVKEKKKRTKIRALSDDALMIGEERRETTDLYLPSIVSPREIKKQLIPARDRFGRRKSLSEGSLNLPAIATGDEKRLTSRLSVTSDSGTHSEDEVQARKKKHVCTCINKREKKLVKTLPTIAQEPKTPTKAFAKLEVLTTKGVFGMHSLVYDDTPSLTLVSNGSTCILISKQFLSDHMTGKLVNTLKQKLPPYPSVANLQTALDDQASWSSYKQKVVHDTIIP